MALQSTVYHFYYTHLHFHISYLHFLPRRYKSESLWLIRPLPLGPRRDAGTRITAAPFAILLHARARAHTGAAVILRVCVCVRVRVIGEKDKRVCKCWARRVTGTTVRVGTGMAYRT